MQPPSPASAIAYHWDDNGNLVERGADTFVWDYEDRMVEATVNSVTSTYAYRGDGLRNSRTVGMTTTQFTWEINAGLPVVLDDGNQYLYGAGLSSMKQGGNWFYYLADGLGSTMAMVDASGDVENGYTYDVYGEPTVTGSLANEFDFAGQQTDASTGLQYLRARYYDPATGVFLSREPLERAPGWMGNRFGYAGANPARYLDPTGHRPCEVDDCSPGVGRKYPAPVRNGGADMPNGDVPVEPDSVYGVCGGLYYYRHPHCRDLVPFNGNAGSLIGEYLLNTWHGCKADPALCAAAIGTQAATLLLSTAIGAGVSGACAGSGGTLCFIVVVGGSRVLHFVTFSLLNQALGRELRAKGAEARGR